MSHERATDPAPSPLRPYDEVIQERLRSCERREDAQGDHADHATFVFRDICGRVRTAELGVLRQQPQQAMDRRTVTRLPGADRDLSPPAIDPYATTDPSDEGTHTHKGSDLAI